jgi:phosphoribosyl-AMP cyclohydrolase
MTDNRKDLEVIANQQPFLWSAIRFDASNVGLIPVVVQQYDSGEVLMVAWMNRSALEETLASGQVCFWSRSRRSLWRKGEQSGQVQHLVEIRIDCDGDTLLVLVDQKGVACHTGRRSCFFRRVDPNYSISTVLPVESDPEKLYGGGSLTA